MMDFFTRANAHGDPDPVPIQMLTTRQRAVVEAIESIEAATGEPCAARQLARRLRLDESTIREHLHRLYRQGWLKTPNAPCSLRRNR
jgi:Mn-dependent DtxR family transcriptional regulator